MNTGIYLQAMLMMHGSRGAELREAHKFRQRLEGNQSWAFRGSWHFEPLRSTAHRTGSSIQVWHSQIFSQNLTSPEEELKAARRADDVEDLIAVALIGGLVLIALTVCGVLATLNTEDPDAHPPSRPIGWPLTPMLVVPDGKLFLFRIPAVIHRGRQKHSFDVLDCHGEAVCVVSADEMQADQPTAIRLLTRVEEKLLAVVFTEQEEKQKSFRICKSDGTVFARISEMHGRYVVRTGNHNLLTCYGDFQNHHIRMLDDNKRKAAVTKPDVDGYTGSVAAGEDVGLVICVLLAIDKLEQPPQASWEKYVEATDLKLGTDRKQKDPFFSSGEDSHPQ